MRHQSKEFVEKFLKEHPASHRNVLEVGSLDVNGNIRDLFKEDDYTGLDMRSGPNVGLVLNAHDLFPHFKEETFDLVVCFDTLEHDDEFWVSVTNMRHVLKSGGYLILGMPSRNCPYHEHPSDYWRIMGPAMSDVFLKGYEDTYTEIQQDNPGLNNNAEDEVYGWGRKPKDEDFALMVLGQS